jgi:hypothetical protein
MKDDLMKYLSALLCCLFLIGCSTTSYEAPVLLSDVDKQALRDVRIYINSHDIVLASQASERLFKLHHTAHQVQEMLENITTAFGFQLTSEKQAEYRLNILAARPDGGECVQGLSSVGKGVSYTMSVITFGILPATNGYCIQVDAELFYRPEVYGELSPDMSFLAAFSVNEGRVNVLAGANEFDNYQRVVTIEDEARALETSIAALLKEMIDKGAFD